jgi:3-hydroxyacyl-[acyl-carrier-protein] dehydratase
MDGVHLAPLTAGGVPRFTEKFYFCSANQKSAEIMLSDYYFINGERTENGETVFGISLNPNSTVYRGHFPGMPVAPGVCSIQMIKECVERLTGHKLRICHVVQCRMTTLLSPQQYPNLHIRIRPIEQDGARLKVQASIGRDGDTYLTLKFEANISQNN